MLEVRNIDVFYGDVQVIWDISFEVKQGEVVALIGANGAGKSTTLRALSALVRPAAGTIRYRGEVTNALPSYALVRKGLALVPEGRGVFARLSVRENLEMGAYHRADRDIGKDLDRVFALMPRLAERSTQLAGTLSGGEQQMLAIGRSLMSRPKLLLLDEPSMGLAPIMVQKVFEDRKSVV